MDRRREGGREGWMDRRRERERESYTRGFSLFVCSFEATHMYGTCITNRLTRAAMYDVKMICVVEQL